MHILAIRANAHAKYITKDLKVKTASRSLRSWLRCCKILVLNQTSKETESALEMFPIVSEANVGV